VDHPDAYTIQIAWISRRYFEDPFLRLKDKLSKKPAHSPAPVQAIQPSYEQPAA
jgi:hypothetical protein